MRAPRIGSERWRGVLRS